jgi:hypothetical protein
MSDRIRERVIRKISKLDVGERGRRSKNGQVVSGSKLLANEVGSPSVHINIVKSTKKVREGEGKVI